MSAERESMRGVPWHRSLYWRIALGLVAFVALMLAAEGALFLWISERLAGSMPARSPRQLAALVARDVSAALTHDPQLDLQTYLVDEYGNVLRTFVVILRDGRVASNHEDVPPELLDRARRRGRISGDGAEAEPLGGSASSRRPRPGAAARLGEWAPVFVNDAQAGRVVVWGGERPFWRIVRRLGPTMAVIGGTVLAVGTALIALVVFRPVRRRLTDVRRATERLGSGDLSARAPEHGGDEVAALARSFNRMADELAARARALAASDRTRRQMMADISHELMTPLTAMRGYVETLTMPEVQIDPQTRQRYMGIITDETHRLEQMIGDLLDLARLEGGMTLRHEPADVGQLFTRVAERHERETSTRRISLTTRVEDTARSLVGDADRLEQALQNLAANALRHTPDGGRIHLTAERDGNEVVVTVRDSGPGIPPEHLPLIFDRFYKADLSRKAAGGAGSGLGLSIVKAIVELHGGRISARNDGGAVFEIRLTSPATDSNQGDK
jgi:signal transduction histidine kinase